MRNDIAETLRAAIRRDGRSLKAIEIAAGLDGGRLSRFTRYERTLTLPSVQKLLAALNVEAKLVRKRGRKER